MLIVSVTVSNNNLNIKHIRLYIVLTFLCVTLFSFAQQSPTLPVSVDENIEFIRGSGVVPLQGYPNILLPRNYAAAPQFIDF